MKRTRNPYETMLKKKKQIDKNNYINNQHKVIIFSDVIIELIINQYISTLINHNHDNNNKTILNHIYHLLLVSKQFYKLKSKIINQKLLDSSFKYEWNKNVINFNNNSKFNYINSPPLYLDTDSLLLFQGLLMGMELHQVKELYSKVETFQVDEVKSNLNKVHYPAMPVSLPTLPSLKNLIINGYSGCKRDEDNQVVKSYGYTYYKSLIKNVKRLSSNSSSCGIANFSIQIIGSHSTDTSDKKQTIEIFIPLFKYHIKSLKSITIQFEHPSSLASLVYWVNEFHEFYNGEEYEYSKRLKKSTKSIQYNIAIQGKAINDYLDYFKKELEEDVYNLLILLFIKNQMKLLNIDSSKYINEDSEDDKDEDETDYSDSIEEDDDYTG